MYMSVYMSCASEPCWQTVLGQFLAIFFRKEKLICARKNPFFLFGDFSQEILLGKDFAIFWFLLQGSRNSLARVAVSVREHILQ